MPFFADAADPAGSLAIALPRNDMTDARRDEMLPLLRQSIKKLEAALTGMQT